MTKQKNEQFEKFDRTMDVLLRHSHADLKAALDAEKVAKAKKKRKLRASASGRAFRGKD
jgi:hypothetical protein